MRTFAFLLPVLLAATPLAQTPRVNPDAAMTAYIGGKWFDGERFEPRDTTWASDGVFTSRPLAPEAARVVDLSGQFVVPPFADAHQHQIEGPWSLPAAEAFMAAGTFYVKMVNNVPRYAEWIKEDLNLPDALDVTFSHGGITSPGAHPIPLYRGLVERGIYRDLDADSLDGIVGYGMGSVQELEARWPEVLAKRPDHIKLLLLDHEQGTGLRPAVFRRAVALAHEAGLRTTVHVLTAADLELALDAGADEAAHLPGFLFERNPAAYRLSDALVARMAETGFVTVTTTLVTSGIDSPDLDAREALQAETIRRLVTSGAPVAIGTDGFDKSGIDEADNLIRIGAVDAHTALKLLTQTAPLSIFPDRAIGRLSPGYEASVLALACDPLEDWKCTRQIAHAEKQGTRVSGSDSTLTRASGDTPDPETTIHLWREVDLATFTAPPEATDGPLLAGLKALVDGNAVAASAYMEEGLESAPDSLRADIYDLIASAAAARFDWDAALVAWEASGDDVRGETMAGWARFPAASVRFGSPEATVAFDHLNVPAHVNGEAVRAIVDTGGPNTSVSRALAVRLGLRIDSTARGYSFVPSAGTTTPNYAVLIDSLQVGTVTFFNVPATVSWTDDGAAGGTAEPGEETVFLGAMLLRRFAGGVRYGYADSTFTIVRDVPATTDRPNTIIEGQLAPVIASGVNGTSALALVDTGSSTDVYLASGAFKIPPEAYTRTIGGTLASGYNWTQKLYALPFEIDGHPAETLEAYEADYILNADSPVTVLLGKTVWRDGTLTLDFVNRRVSYAPSSP